MNPGISTVRLSNQLSMGLPATYCEERVSEISLLVLLNKKGIRRPVPSRGKSLCNPGEADPAKKKKKTVVSAPMKFKPAC